MCNWKGRDFGCILLWWEAILGKKKNETQFLPYKIVSLSALLKWRSVFTKHTTLLIGGIYLTIFLLN
jgi:hypothetical protein